MMMLIIMMMIMTTKKRFDDGVYNDDSDDVVVVLLLLLFLLLLLLLVVVVMVYDDDDGTKVRDMSFGCCYKITPFILSKVNYLISHISLNMKTSKSERFTCVILYDKNLMLTYTRQERGFFMKT